MLERSASALKSGAAHRLLVAVLGLLCPAVVVQAQPIQCPETAADASDWPRSEEGDFSLKIPPRFSEIRITSVDSQVGKWRAGDATIYYDFGVYSNPLDPNEQGVFPDLTVCQHSQGPETPRIVVFRDEETGNVRMGAHWPEVPDPFHESIKLTVGGAVPTEQSRAELLAVIQSVRFHPRDE